MQKKSPITIAVIILWFVSLACGQTANVPTLDPNAAQTAIVETMIAIQGQTTPSEIPLNVTPTLEVAATPSLSPTAEPTGTPTTPQISVSVDTFCRVGPGKDYEKVGILLVGETTDIVGRDAFGQFWYVRNPDVGLEFCWMSGEYATISGNVFALLVQTPPAAPSTGFEAAYRGQGHCASVFWSDIRLKNLSSGWFKSISLVVRDLDTNTVHSMTANEFAFTDGCSAPTSVDILIQGGTVMISSPEFSYNMNAHNMSATIILCTELNLTGSCVTKGITYKP